MDDLTLDPMVEVWRALVDCSDEVARLYADCDQAESQRVYLVLRAVETATLCAALASGTTWRR